MNAGKGREAVVAKRPLHRVAMSVVWGLALAAALAGSAKADLNRDFSRFIDEMRGEARASGISEATLDVAFADVRPVQKVLQRDRKQAEFTLTFDTYYARVVNDATVSSGRRHLAEESALLGSVAQRLGVQPRFLLAIWGIESRFGQVTGDYDVIASTATLAFDGRRSFWRGELISALKMIERGYIERERMTGSWAGAMGQPQFIPSSYLAYAVDFDGDGRRNIWTSRADVFGSVANYLARHGWDPSVTWGREVRLPSDWDVQGAPRVGVRGKGCRAMKDMSGAWPLSTWQDLGVRRADGGDLPGRDLPARLVRPDGPGGRAFLVYANYDSILRYNCSHLYALTVGLLSDRIAGR